jgi:hypothetical protein
MERVATPKRKKVLDTHACAELNVHLNSFYVQLRGALDNLAWVLHYEHDVLGSADESDQPTRTKCNLFDGRFLKGLDASHSLLASALRAKRPWFNDFKERRDPVAHRVPLYAMPGVIRQGSPDAESVQRLSAESGEAFARGDIEEGTRKLFESWSVGEYVPWFTQYAPNGYSIRDIPTQIGADHNEFLTVSEAAFATIWPRPSS